MRITDLLYDHETVADAPADSGAPADVGGEPADALAVEAPVVEQPQMFTAEQAEELFDARIQALIESAPAAERAQVERDLNELLNPLSDEFGTNLGSYLEERLNAAIDRIEQKLGPVLSASEQAQIDRGEQRINDILETAGVPQDARPVARDLATSYLPEMEGRYGKGTPRAAEAALEKATQAVKALTGTAGRAGGQAEIDRLAAVAGATQTPSGAGGAHVIVPEAARTPQELFQRRFGAANGRQN